MARRKKIEEPAKQAPSKPEKTIEQKKMNYKRSKRKI